jgi:GT2 family glycosyltransferase
MDESDGASRDAARNAGRKSPRGQVIALTDDDTIPEPDWLESALPAMSNGLEAASGRVVVPLPRNPTDNELDAAGLATADFVTANCFVRRSALEDVGGFDEAFCAAWREDSDLHFSLERGSGRHGGAVPRRVS